MTWGSHCSMCGSEACNWVDGTICEGIVFPDRMEARRKYKALSWYKKISYWFNKE